MSQRLVRILCNECKVFEQVDAQAWLQLVQPFDVPTPVEVARPVGCRACRETGYSGRQGIYELLVNSPALAACIVPDMESRKVREVAMSEGMRTLRLAGAAKVAAGATTIEEVMRVAPLFDA